MKSILFVCLGNICRSPAAEGLLRHMSQKFEDKLDIHIESCGLGGWHLGQLPNEEMREAAEERGIILMSRAQLFKMEFFEKFDYILAVDHSVINTLYTYAKTPEHKAKIHLITEFSKTYHREEIPDPFCRGRGAFDNVLDMLEDACQGLLEHLKN